MPELKENAKGTSITIFANMFTASKAVGDGLLFEPKHGNVDG